MAPRMGRWSSPQAERRFRRLEDELWRELMPQQPETLDVETPFGRTRAYRWPGTGEPIVLLHGMGGTSLQWTQYVGALRGRTTYAIDTMGDVGRSSQRAELRDAADVVRWLDEALTELAVPRAHFAGVSYGGWIALNEASRSPDRVASIALFDPVGLGPIDMRHFMIWGICVFSAALAPARLRRHIAVWTRMPLVEDRRMLRLLREGNFRHRLGTPQPHPLTDDELRVIASPMLVLLAEKSEIYRSPSAVASRAQALVPDAEVEIVAGAGHALPVSHADLVIDRLNRFLDAQSPAAGPGASRGA